MFTSLRFFIVRIFTLLLFGVSSICTANEAMVINITEGIEELPFEVGDVDSDNSSNFVETIDVTKITGPTFDLSRAIENTNGIQIRKNGGVGNFTSISIRGKSADQVTVYLDGMPVNNASGGSVDLSRIPTNQVARIEVYKDSFPVEFSEVANGGVINIITHRAAQNKLNLAVSAGSFQTNQLDYNGAFSTNDWKFISSGGYLASKNDFTFNFENNTFLNPNDDEIQKRYNNELYRTNFFGKATRQLSTSESVYFQTEYFNKQKNIPTIYNKPDAQSTLIDLNKNLTMGYKNNVFLFSGLSASGILKLTSKETRFIDKLGDILLTPTENQQTHNNIESKIYLKYQAANYDLTTSNTLRAESLNVVDNIDNKQIRENLRYLLTSSLGLNYYLMHDRFVVSPVVRSTVSADQYRGETESITGVVAVSSFTKSYRTLSPQLGVQFKANPDLTFSSNLSQYFRLPNYVELFGTRGFIGSSEDLLPEEGINFDAGFRYLKYFHSQRITRLSWDMAFFHSQLKNEIVYIFAARGVGKPMNINKSTISGIENTVSIELDYDLLFSSSTTFQAPINASNNYLLPGRSFWFQKTRLELNKNRYKGYVEHNAQSVYYLDSQQDIPSAETSIVNTGVEAKFKKAVFSLTINNLFNQQIKDYFFQPASGRNVFFTTEYYFN